MNLFFFSLDTSISPNWISFKFFFFFFQTRVKLIFLNNPRCYLRLHSTMSLPAYICTTASCTNLLFHLLLARGLQWIHIWTSVSDSLETFHKKTYWWSQHSNLCLQLPHSKRKSNKKKAKALNSIALHFSFLISLLWHLPVGTGTRQLGFVSKFKYSLSWQCGPSHPLHCQLSCL